MTLELTNNRLVPNAMEPRAAIAEYNDAEEHFTLYTTSQNPHVARLVLSAFYNIAPEHKLRVIAPDVGGGFGSKIFIYPEEMVALWASKKGRPAGEVDWRPHRGLSHRRPWPRSRDPRRRWLSTRTTISLGLRVKTHANLGAYMSLFSSSVPTYLYATLLSGQYNIPNIYAEVMTRLHQHHAGRRLSRRRPPGSQLSGRTDDGNRGAAVEGRSGGVAPQELHHPVPAPDARDHGL